MFDQLGGILQLSPNSGLPSTRVVATGYGFAAGETVSFTYNYTTSIGLGTRQADDTGGCVFTFTVPSTQNNQGSGSYYVEGTGQTSGRSVGATFYQQWPYMYWASSNYGQPGSWPSMNLY